MNEYIVEGWAIILRSQINLSAEKTRIAFGDFRMSWFFSNPSNLLCKIDGHIIYRDWRCIRCLGERYAEIVTPCYKLS